jgi:hypothetical protein
MNTIKINYNPTDDVGYKHDIWKTFIDKYNALTIAPDDITKEECLLLFPLDTTLDSNKLERDLYPIKILH